MTLLILSDSANLFDAINKANPEKKFKLADDTETELCDAILFDADTENAFYRLEREKNRYKGIPLFTITSAGTTENLIALSAFGSLYTFIRPIDCAFILSRTESFLNGRQPLLSNAEISAEALLNYVGVKREVLGRKYLKNGIIALALSTVDLTFIYEYLSSEFKEPYSRIERNMRYAVETAFNKGNIYAQYEIFGYTVSQKSGKPTNLEFLSALSVALKEKLL
ncbi:MAG: sporulation initiation factor Spo0A C-terminal domain-containing protein [Clostridia bacterium]